MDNEEYTKIKDIIQNNNLNIDICTDQFFIIDDWTTLNFFVALYNGYKDSSFIEYGRLIQSIDNPDFKRIDDMLPEWGFSDENLVCDDCYNHITTTPGFYGDIPQYSIIDSSVYCGDCIKESHKEEYIEILTNNPNQANIILTSDEMQEQGFKQCFCNEQECKFWSGLYQGANDNPKEILKNAIAKNPDKEYVFDITAVGQFDINYTIWNRNKAIEGTLT